MTNFKTSSINLLSLKNLIVTSVLLLASSQVSAMGDRPSKRRAARPPVVSPAPRPRPVAAPAPVANPTPVARAEVAETPTPASTPTATTTAVPATTTPAPVVTPSVAAAATPAVAAITPVGAATGNNPCNRTGVSNIPAPSSPQRATDFINTIRQTPSGPGRDARVLNEIGCGNIPPALRNLTPVTTQINGQTVTICVARDYLSVGTEQDFVHTPLGLPAASRAAAAMGMMLPTTSMVDSIYQQADLQIAASPMPAGDRMTSTSYFHTHSQSVRGQMNLRGGSTARLIAGHKKDVVTANAPSGRVSIYGWQRANGQRIQPLYHGHGAEYADYSHGIRFISQVAFDSSGNPVRLPDLLSRGSNPLNSQALAPYTGAPTPLSCDRAATPGGTPQPVDTGATPVSS